MKIAYLILAHEAPNHLKRLIAALSSDASGFFVHIDRKSDIDLFSNLKGDDVHFTRERIPVFWGDFSQVEAIIILIRTVLSDSCGFDRFVLLSGADYPLRSAPAIERFFERHPDTEFMDLIAMPSEAAEKPISRLTTYKLRSGTPLPGRIARKALMLGGLFPRQRDYNAYLRDLAPYGGSTWWALSREACNFIMTFVEKESRVVDFFRNTVCPDESFFQTILGNSRFKSRMARGLTYADWGIGESNPAYITERHLAMFESTAFPPDDVYGSGEKLFVRKFPDDSGELVAKLKNQIGP